MKWKENEKPLKGDGEAFLSLELPFRLEDDLGHQNKPINGFFRQNRMEKRYYTYSLLYLLKKLF